MNPIFSSKKLDEAQVNYLSTEISRYCRLCLLHRGTVDILSEDMMAKLFKLNIELLSKYKLPQKICKFCESTINTFFEQRETYEKNQWTLFKMMKTLDNTKESLKKCTTLSTPQSADEHEGNIKACNEVYKTIMNSFGKKKCTVFECEPNKDSVFPGVEIRELGSSDHSAISSDFNGKSGVKNVQNSPIKRLNNVDEFKKVVNTTKDNGVLNKDNGYSTEEVHLMGSKNNERNSSDQNARNDMGNDVSASEDNLLIEIRGNNSGEFNEDVDTTNMNDVHNKDNGYFSEKVPVMGSKDYGRNSNDHINGRNGMESGVPDIGDNLLIKMKKDNIDLNEEVDTTKNNDVPNKVYSSEEVRAMDSSELNRNGMESDGPTTVDNSPFKMKNSNPKKNIDDLNEVVGSTDRNVINEGNCDFGVEKEMNYCTIIRNSSKDTGEDNEINYNTIINNNKDNADFGESGINNEVNINIINRTVNEEKADLGVDNDGHSNTIIKNNRDKTDPKVYKINSFNANTSRLTDLLELKVETNVKKSSELEHDNVELNVNKIGLNKIKYESSKDKLFKLENDNIKPKIKAGMNIRTYGSARKDSKKNEKCQNNFFNTNTFGTSSGSDARNMSKDDNCGNAKNRQKYLASSDEKPSDDTSSSMTENIDIVPDLFSVDAEDKLSLIPHDKTNSNLVVFLKRPHLNSFLTENECSFNGFETKDLVRTKWKLKKFETIHEAHNPPYYWSSFVKNGRLISYIGQESQGWLIDESSLKFGSEENQQDRKENSVESPENREGQTGYEIKIEMVKKGYGKQTNDEVEKTKGKQAKRKTYGAKNTMKSNGQTQNSRNGTSRIENKDKNDQNRNTPGHNETERKSIEENTECQEDSKKRLNDTNFLINQKPVKNLVEFLQAQKRAKLSNSEDKSNENKQKSLLKSREKKIPPIIARKIKKEKESFVDEGNITACNNTTAGETANKDQHGGKSEEKVGTHQNEKQNDIDQNQNLTVNQIESKTIRKSPTNKTPRKNSKTIKNLNKRTNQSINENESFESFSGQFEKRKRVEIGKTGKPGVSLRVNYDAINETINKVINDALRNFNGEDNHIEQNDISEEIEHENKCISDLNQQDNNHSKLSENTLGKPSLLVNNALTNVNDGEDNYMKLIDTELDEIEHENKFIIDLIRQDTHSKLNENTLGKPSLLVNDIISDTNVNGEGTHMELNDTTDEIEHDDKLNSKRKANLFEQEDNSKLNNTHETSERLGTQITTNHTTSQNTISNELMSNVLTSLPTVTKSPRKSVLTNSINELILHDVLTTLSTAAKSPRKRSLTNSTNELISSALTPLPTVTKSTRKRTYSMRSQKDSDLESSSNEIIGSALTPCSTRKRTNSSRSQKDSDLESSSNEIVRSILTSNPNRKRTSTNSSNEHTNSILEHKDSDLESNDNEVPRSALTPTRKRTSTISSNEHTNNTFEHKNSDLESSCSSEIPRSALTSCSTRKRTSTNSSTEHTNSILEHEDSTLEGNTPSETITNSTLERNRNENITNSTLGQKDSDLETNKNDINRTTPLPVTPKSPSKSTEITTAGLISNILDPSSSFFNQSPRKSSRRNSYNQTKSMTIIINEKLQNLGQKDGCKVDDNINTNMALPLLTDTHEKPLDQQDAFTIDTNSNDKINTNISLPVLTPEKDNTSMSLQTNTPEKSKHMSLRINSAKKNNGISQPTDITPEKSLPNCSDGDTNSANPNLSSSKDEKITENNVTSNSNSSLAPVENSAKRLRTPRGPGKSSVNKLSAKALENSNGLQLQMAVEKVTNKIRSGQKFVPAAKKNQA